MFVYLCCKFKDTKPAVPYFLLIGASMIMAQFVSVPMLHMYDVDLELALPTPHIEDAMTRVYLVGFCAMLATIGVTKQVMSNAA